MAALMRNHVAERGLKWNVEAHVVSCSPPRGSVNCKGGNPCDETDRPDKEASKAPNHQLLDLLLSLKLWFPEGLSKEPSSIHTPQKGKAEEPQVEILGAQ